MEAAQQLMDGLAKTQAISLARPRRRFRRLPEVTMFALNQLETLEISCKQCIPEIYAQGMVRRIKFA